MPSFVLSSLSPQVISFLLADIVIFGSLMGSYKNNVTEYKFMFSTVLSIVICYFIFRLERAYIFKKPLNTLIAIINATIVSITSTAISITIVYAIFFDNFMRPEYRILNDGLIREVMFGVILSWLVSFSLSKANLDKKQENTTKQDDDNNPWLQK